MARDIPFFALVAATMVLVPWRARALLAQLRAEGSFTTRVSSTARTLTHALDIPAAIVFTAMLATWRAPVMVAFARSKYRQLWRGMGAAELAAVPAAHKAPLFRFVAAQAWQVSVWAGGVVGGRWGGWACHEAWPSFAVAAPLWRM